MTPLSETLYEATQYLRGGAVDFGNNSRLSPNSGDAFPSVAASRQAGNSNLYDSPMDLNCQKTYIVFLTDGLPTSDNEADAEIQTLTGATCSGTGDGRCLEELSGYLFSSDLRADVAGQQNVTSYWIGFGDISSGATLLERHGDRGWRAVLWCRRHAAVDRRADGDHRRRSATIPRRSRRRPWP